MGSNSVGALFLVDVKSEAAPGCLQAATAKRARTIFSPSPTHLLISEDDEMEKKVLPERLAIAKGRGDGEKIICCFKKPSGKITMPCRYWNFFGGEYILRTCRYQYRNLFFG